MSEALFLCPAPAALTDIPTQACPERFDQIVRFFFQRKQATSSFTDTTIKTQATWTPLLSASDNTKIVKSPLIPGVTIPAGEVIKEGGNDNSTINGIARLGGRPFVPVSTQLQDVEAAVRAALRKLASESSLLPGYTNLWMYMVNRFGQIIGSKNGTNVDGIEVFNVYVGDTGTEGLNKSNINNFVFDLAPGWSDNVAIYTPDAGFNPLNL